MPNSKPTDLSNLISNAANEVAHARIKKPQTQQRLTGRTIAVAGLVALAVLLIVKTLFAFTPPTHTALTKDLDQSVSLALRSVEEARTRTGELPSTLPNASLAAVVGYESRQRDFRLVAEAGSVRIVIGWDGARTVEKVSP